MRSLLKFASGLTAAALVFSLAACGAPKEEPITEAEPVAVEATPEPEDAAEIAAADLSANISEEVLTATVLPKCEDAGRAYIDETLFLGDSNTARYMMYADETQNAFTSLNNNIGVVSMSAGQISSLKCEEFVGMKGLYTMPEAVAMLKPQRIIIGFGSNNLSGTSTDASRFIDTYQKGIKAIEEAWPHCDIIVNAIPPLDKERSNTNLYMVQVSAYNAALVEMCDANGWKFLNSSEVLLDETTGWAKKGFTLADGVHLSKEGVTAFFEYVRTHAYVTPDRRPTPLGKIPTPAGTPPGLISADPIASKTKKVTVPVEFTASSGGHISGSTSQSVGKGGTCSTVTAVADEGFAFSYWTCTIGSCGGSESLTFTVPANADANGVIVTAHFEAKEHYHDFEQVDRVEPKCGVAGFIKYRCKGCGEGKEETLAAQEHQWDGGTQTQTATCTTEGIITYTCGNCGASKQSSTGTTDHSWNGGEQTQTATCTTEGIITYTCNSCGATKQSSTGTTDHSWNGGTQTQAPTCTTEGIITYTCNSCGATYNQSTGTSSHNYQCVSDTSPTENDCGHRTYQCSSCGNSYSENYGEPLGSSIGSSEESGGGEATTSDEGGGGE